MNFDNSYTPYFTCEFCGDEKPASVNTDGTGMFVPCQCKEARENRDRQHHIEMERRKQMKRRK